ncbi:hypothetical protein DID88_010479 [Monilinia fructigena]|uniref:RING-type domain-containing protein n=1 Tax=Monilinia fructigena TaxID=38457 RepID=A0A395ILI6_9HELO|nr:hypothetical protein DID88_010479 [Monilinia fructigena]
MTQPPPRESPGGPSRNESYHIKKGVGDVIEISDSSDDDYEDAHGSRQVPSQPPPPPRPQNRQLGFFDVRNQMIGLDEGVNLNSQYLHSLPQSAAAAAGMPRINMNQHFPVKNEEPGIDWAQWIDGENDEQVNRILWEDYTNQAESHRSSNLSSGLDQLIQQPNQPQPIVETEVECINAVMAVFPEICRDHVAGLYETLSQSSDQLISHILDKVDTGSPYPTAKDAQRRLKRKREFSEEEEAIQKYEVANRNNELTSFLQQSLIRSILSFEFPQTPMTFLDWTLQKSGHRLFPAHRALEEAHRTFDTANPKYNKIKNPRRMPTLYREAEIEEAIQKNETSWKTEIFKELQVARRVRNSTESRRRAQREAELAEEENERIAQAEGTMSECGCCFGDYPLNRMVHCNNEEVLHWFCRGCARQTAENEIGNSKYELNCMSTDGCEAGFSLEQRNQFLDEPTIIALERNEAEAVLRMAGIENLASCPFCPYAAEYPPVEVNREFRCQAPDCEKVSCRLCKLESHIPKSCEENARENGLSARRQIEEAMSAAMIRKCNKCGTPFVKEEGCNKMTCRKGKPLIKVRAEHPEYSEEDLKVKMSENVESMQKHHLDVNRIQNELENLRNPRDLELQLPVAGDLAPLEGLPIIHLPVPAGADIPMVPRAIYEQSQEEKEEAAKVKEQNKLEAEAEAKA